MPSIGHPYHGQILTDGTLQSDHATPGPDIATTLPTSVGPETYLVQTPSPPADQRTAAEQAADAAAFKEWRSYALLRGTSRYLFDQAIGQNAWLCFDDNGIPWRMVVEIAPTVSPDVVITLKAAAVFGRVNSGLVPADHIVDSWTISDAEYADSASRQFKVQPSPDGRSAYINYYGAPTYPEIISVVGITNAKRLCRVDLLTISGTGGLTQATLGDGLVANLVNHKGIADLYIEGSESYGPGYTITGESSISIGWTGSNVATTYSVDCSVAPEGTLGDQDDQYDVAIYTPGPLDDNSQSATSIERHALYCFDGQGAEHVIKVVRIDEDKRHEGYTITGDSWEWHRVSEYQCSGGSRNLTGSYYNYTVSANPSVSYLYQRHAGLRYLITSGSLTHEISCGTQYLVEGSEDFSGIDLSADGAWNGGTTLVPSNSTTNLPDMDSIVCGGQCLVNYTLVGDTDSQVLGEQGQSTTAPVAANQIALHPVSLQWSQDGAGWT